ncbi:LacI family DNA-binding transcriptional regulator [Corynebacterium pseudopelargi]|uniref:HTH-type transcriptional regulator DegA n=1 Tax=Corynebacterium pseudopelargi TaxID=2080757 RepID=A0A3G6IVP2_9CORY|nr:LacI family DNA-binding transcriptional regulator [Corynebacterium pseudopelargi]AZA09851.1 HTH-type transcriptional regulator DegA [Corynebacterium pseudopelargi]
MTHTPFQRRRPTTLKDIANEIGLSVSTVSRALADNPAIAEETRETVREAARRLRYRPNNQAASLRKQRTNIIGVAIPDIENPFFATLASAIQHSARAKGFSILLGNTEEDPELLASSIEMFANQRVDGMIVVPHGETEAIFEDAVDEGIPIVAVDRRLDIATVPSVVSDPAPGFAAAMDAVLANPNATIGFLAGPQDTSTGLERFKVMQALAKERGVDLHIEHGGYNQRDGYKGTVAMLDAGVNAVIGGDAMLTMGAVQALCERSIAIGKDCALVGFDELPMFLYHNPPLSTIDQQVSKMGHEAFELLHEMLSGQHVPESKVLPTIMHDRGSTTLA